VDIDRYIRTPAPEARFDPNIGEFIYDEHCRLSPEECARRREAYFEQLRQATEKARRATEAEDAELQREEEQRLLEAEISAQRRAELLSDNNDDDEPRYIRVERAPSMPDSQRRAAMARLTKEMKTIFKRVGLSERQVHAWIVNEILDEANVTATVYKREGARILSVDPKTFADTVDAALLKLRPGGNGDIAREKLWWHLYHHHVLSPLLPDLEPARSVDDIPISNAAIVDYLDFWRTSGWARPTPKPNVKAQYDGTTRFAEAPAKKYFRLYQRGDGA
jgi:hypothetical protein